MPYGEVLAPRIKVGTVSNPDAYYKALSGSQLVCSILDGANNIIARGTGMNWNETFQQSDLPEWGQRHSLEIVSGRQPIGQMTIQTFFYMHLNDSLPTTSGLKAWAVNELSGIVQIAEHEDPILAGLIIDAFEGVKIAGQSGNWNAQSQYIKNVSLVYRVRLNGLEWVQAHAGGTTYPAVKE